MLPFGAPLFIFLPPPTKFLLSPKKKNLGRHFFSGFSYRILDPLELFLPPNIFFCGDQTLSWPRCGPFCCLVERFFVKKTVNSVICRPPKVPSPCIAGVAGAVATPLELAPIFHRPLTFCKSIQKAKRHCKGPETTQARSSLL